MTKTSPEPGFAEDPPKKFVPTVLPRHWRLKVAPDGRFVIPAAARAEMNIGENGEVTAYLQDGELRILSYFTAVKNAQAFVKAHDTGGGSVVDELIAERRAAAELGE